MDQENMSKLWYDQTLPEDGAKAQAPRKPKRKKRTGMKITMIVICVLILIAASALVFSEDYGEKPADTLLAPTPKPEINDEDDDGGLELQPEGDNDTEDELPEDFHDFFNNYYVDGESMEGSSIKRAANGTGVTLELVSAEGRPELSLQEIYTSCIESIVGIKASSEAYMGSYAWGTGIIMTADGYILTNAHVISGCNAATVVLHNGMEYEASLVGEDVLTDVAVLKIKAVGLKSAEFGISDELSVGDDVVAIGNPLGSELSGTMTNGIISAINRNVNYEGRTMTLLQTNAAINEGNSGGPLINMYGQVIGITNMKMAAGYSQVSIEGIGFAIPSSSAKAITDQLIESGEVEGRPGMGITVGAIPTEYAKYYDLPYGLYIVAVSEGSDAEKQGVRPGDVLTHINGIAVLSTEDVLVIRDEHSVGDIVTFTIFRDGETFDVDIMLCDLNKLY